MSDLVKGFQTTSGLKKYDFNSLENVPDAIKSETNLTDFIQEVSGGSGGTGSGSNIFIDANLEKEGYAADAKAVGQALAGKVNSDQLTTAVETAVTSALQEAKDSGIFKGDRGENGLTPNLTIGTVTTLSAGSNATATITGTTSSPVLNLGIPKGRDGSGGSTGEGIPGEAGGYYTPSVDSSGNLSWLASKSDMPSISSVNIKGPAGKGITHIDRTNGTGAQGTTDTYTIYYTDNSTSTFTVYNGKDGTSGSGSGSESNVVFVTLTLNDSVFTSSHTFSQMVSLLDSGKGVFVRYGGQIYPLAIKSNTELSFELIYKYSEGLEMYLVSTIIIKNSNTITSTAEVVSFLPYHSGNVGNIPITKQADSGVEIEWTPFESAVLDIISQNFTNVAVEGM